MSRLITLLVFLFSCTACKRNTVREYVQEHTQEIRTVDPEAADHTDLEAIGAAIGDARVVLLGEQDHGDAPAFLAKRRIIRYLHEQKGFNVLAFESDYFALNEGWAHVPKDSSPISSFLRGNIFSLWTGCDASAPLFRTYIPATFASGRPLQVTGFDSQPHGAYTARFLRAYLQEAFRRQRIDVAPGTQAVLLGVLDSLYLNIRSRVGEDGDLFGGAGAALDTVLARWPQSGSADAALPVLRNLKAFFQQIEHRHEGRASWPYRDEQMAKNLAWLIREKYRSEKLIVWAANYHLLKVSGAGEQEPFQWTTMGTVLARDSALAGKMYTLGFTSRDGTAGRLQSEPYVVAAPPAESFERWIDSKLRYAFVDFRAAGRQLREAATFSMKGIGPNYNAPWMTMFDGVFYIRDMYPCKPGSERKQP